VEEMPVIASARFVSTAAALGLVAALAGCGESNRAAKPAGTPSPSSASRTVVEVSCDPSRTIANTATAIVDRDGLHVKVTDSSGRRGTYLSYRYATATGLTPGGGDSVPAGTTDHVLQVPPGDVYLECSDSLGTTATAPVKVRASDPNGYYRPITLAALGCSPSGIVSWAVGPAGGKTPQAALDALIVASEQRSGLHARLAPIGYVGSGSRTYILERSGTPWATAHVSPEGAGYVAGLDTLC
jgi:hypothetical protein